MAAPMLSLLQPLPSKTDRALGLCASMKLKVKRKLAGAKDIYRRVLKKDRISKQQSPVPPAPATTSAPSNYDATLDHSAFSSIPSVIAPTEAVVTTRTRGSTFSQEASRDQITIAKAAPVSLHSSDEVPTPLSTSASRLSAHARLPFSFAGGIRSIILYPSSTTPGSISTSSSNSVASSQDSWRTLVRLGLLTPPSSAEILTSKDSPNAKAVFNTRLALSCSVVGRELIVRPPPLRSLLFGEVAASTTLLARDESENSNEEATTNPSYLLWKKNSLLPPAYIKTQLDPTLLNVQASNVIALKPPAVSTPVNLTPSKQLASPDDIEVSTTAPVLLAPETSDTEPITHEVSTPFSNESDTEGGIRIDVDTEGSTFSTVSFCVWTERKAEAVASPFTIITPESQLSVEDNNHPLASTFLRRCECRNPIPAPELTPPSTLPSSTADDQEQGSGGLVITPTSAEDAPRIPSTSRLAPHDLLLPAIEEQNPWSPFGIPLECVMALLVRQLQNNAEVLGDISLRDVSLPDIESSGQPMEGSNNVIFFLVCKGLEWVIKVPKRGHGSAWTTNHKYELTSGVATLDLINELTQGKCRVPQVMAYDEDMENEINAPYVITDRLPGIPAYQLWYDYTTHEGRFFYSQPPVKNVEIRQRILESLAENMAALSVVTSPQMGMAFYDTNGEMKVGPFVSGEGDFDALELTSRDKYSSASAFYHKLLLEKYPEGTRTPEEEVLVSLYMNIFKSWPISSAFETTIQTGLASDRFTLAHPDLGMQNILIDPVTFEVTGIIDWDGAAFVPGCVGHISFPLPLRQDMVHWPYDPLCPQEQIPYYQSVYTSAMRRCLGASSDAIFVGKNSLYNAIHTSLYPNMNMLNGDAKQLLRGFLYWIKPDEEYKEFVECLAGGYEEAEQIVEAGVRRILEFR